MDISSKTCMFSLLGPQADAVMQQLQAGALADAPHGSHTLLSFAGGCLAGWQLGLDMGRPPLLRQCFNSPPCLH